MSSDLQSRLQGAAGFALVLVESVAVDVQCGRNLLMPQKLLYLFSRVLL